MNLSLNCLTKRYGEKVALDNVSMIFEKGVYGLLGPNGAGKSTLMNIVVGNLPASGGSVTVDGEDTRKMGVRFRSLLGYMPQQQRLYDHFSGRDFLMYMAVLKGVPKDIIAARVNEIAEQVNMREELKHRLGAYSGGMKQKILIASAIINDPDILILDEPTAGLDPKERIRLRNLISRIALDKLVIIATHVVLDVEYISRQIILLNKGKVLRNKTIPELTDEIKDYVYMITAAVDDLPRVEDSYQVSSIQSDGKIAHIRIISEMPPTGYRFERAIPTLEDVYLYFFGAFD